jgi:hypothetical protein
VRFRRTTATAAAATNRAATNAGGTQPGRPDPELGAEVSGGSAASVTAAAADCVVSDVVGGVSWGEPLGLSVGASEAGALELSGALVDLAVGTPLGGEVGTP